MIRSLEDFLCMHDLERAGATERVLNYQKIRRAYH